MPKKNEEFIKLSDLTDLFNNKEKYFVSEIQGHTGVDIFNSSQGEYNEVFKYYKHPGLPENIFLQETWHSDSYARNHNIKRIDFVEGKTKTITVYEPIQPY